MLISLLLLAQVVGASSGLDRGVEYACPGLEEFQIQVVHHVDFGWGTIRSKTTGRSIGIGVGPMVEELAPHRRPAGYRWYKSETVGSATVTYGLFSESNLVQATILGARLSTVVNLVGKPEDQALLLSVARNLATAQCTRVKADP